MMDRSRQGPDTAERRAAELVDQVGQLLSDFAAPAFRQIVAAGARAREDAEPIWVGAQAVAVERARGGR